MMSAPAKGMKRVWMALGDARRPRRLVTKPCRRYDASSKPVISVRVMWAASRLGDDVGVVGRQRRGGDGGRCRSSARPSRTRAGSRAAAAGSARRRSAMTSRAGTIGAHMSMAGIGVVHRDPLFLRLVAQPCPAAHGSDAAGRLRRRSRCGNAAEADDARLGLRTALTPTARSLRDLRPLSKGRSSAQLEVSALSPKPMNSAIGAGCSIDQRVR